MQKHSEVVLHTKTKETRKLEQFREGEQSNPMKFLSTVIICINGTKFERK